MYIYEICVYGIYTYVYAIFMTDNLVMLFVEYTTSLAPNITQLPVSFLRTP